MFPKSKKENEKWTFLKMSKNKNPKYFSKNTLFSRCDLNALIVIFNFETFMMIIFKKNKINYLGDFFVFF
jgi:hypothetical protein